MSATFFDTSALVKSILREDATEVARALWDRSTIRFGSRLLYVETHSALAAAERTGRVGAAERRVLAERFSGDFTDLTVIELSPAVADVASELALDYALTGADAIHLASALTLAERTPTIFATWDRRLHAAAADCGLGVPVL